MNMSAHIQGFSFSPKLLKEMIKELNINVPKEVLKLIKTDKKYFKELIREVIREEIKEEVKKITRGFNFNEFLNKQIIEYLKIDKY